MSKGIIVLIFTLILAFFCRGQGLNHQWLIGYWPYPDTGVTTSGCPRILFDATGSVVISEEYVQTYCQLKLRADFLI